MIPKPADQIIPSNLDGDVYDLSQAEASQQYTGVLSSYGYVNRNDTRFFRYFVDAVREQVEAMATLSLQPEEAKWLKIGMPYLKDRFIHWLEHFRFNPEAVILAQQEDHFQMQFVGPSDEMFVFDTPLMAIMSEVYTTMSGVKPDKGYEKRAAEKARNMKEAGVNFAEFGTRRRFSREVQQNVIEAMLPYRAEPGKPGGLVGTSNMMFAMKYGLKAIGTYSHAWVMLHQGIYGTRMANKMAMEAWSREFSALLGTALTDTYTTEVFFRDFGPYFAKLFDGLRCDSMDPFEWIPMVLAHYRKLPGNINPANKQMIFTNSLTDDLAIAIHQSVAGQAIDSYGIGTFLTNDIWGYKHPDFVNKLQRVFVPFHGWTDVCKFSDVPGKTSGDLRAVEHAQYELHITA